MTKKKPEPHAPSFVIVREKDVLKQFNMGPTQLQEAVDKGEFPRPIRIFESGRAKGWLDYELRAHAEARAKARDAELTKHRTKTKVGRDV